MAKEHGRKARRQRHEKGNKKARKGIRDANTKEIIPR
jgi:hypothetical protein